MVRALQRAILAAVGLAGLAVLAGCSAGPWIDKLPPELGEPAGTPPRPTDSFQYPAVHDMPPARATEPMTEEDQVKLENDLKIVRDRQAGRPPDKKGAQDAAKKAAPDAKTAKKKPASAGGGEAAGVKTNP
jgi:hypothetical protein